MPARAQEAQKLEPLEKPSETIENTLKSEQPGKINNHKATPNAIDIQLNDLKAQERMALATESMDRATQKMAFLSMLSMIAMIGTIGLLYWTLRETRKMTNLTRSQNRSQKNIGENSTKAYISGESCRLYLPETDDQDTRLVIQITNSGQTPALRIQCVIGGSHWHHWSQASGRVGTACPGQTEVTIETSMKKSEFSEMMFNWEEGLTIGPSVNGTIFYEDIYGTLYQSTFYFLLDISYGSETDLHPSTSIDLPKWVRGEELFEAAPESDQLDYDQRKVL